MLTCAFGFAHEVKPANWSVDFACHVARLLTLAIEEKVNNMWTFLLCLC